MVMVRPVLLAETAEAASRWYAPLLSMMYAPCIVGVMPGIWAHSADWLALSTLKPATSCSAPKTRMLFALRAAVVLGTFAHDSANGAAASVAPRELLTTFVVAVAEAARSVTPATTPTSIQTVLCIDFPPFDRRREPFTAALPAPRPKGRTVTTV